MQKVEIDHPPVVVTRRPIPYSGVYVVNLSLIFSKQLTRVTHIVNSCNKAFGALQELRRHKWILSLIMRKCLVQTLVLPWLNYCCIVTHGMTAECKLYMQRVQNCRMLMFLLSMVSPSMTTSPCTYKEKDG